MKTEKTSTNDVLVVADVHFKDVILIQTLNSLYRFSVGKAVSYGRLIGGVFRGCAVDATLCAPRLRVGARARLLVSSGSTWKLLTTSIIKSLTHIRGDA